MILKMSDDNVSFISGSLLASIPALSWLWPLQINALDPINLAYVWMIKVIGTIILGFIGGLTGMLGKDAYRYFKQKLNRHESKDISKRSNSGTDSTSGNIQDL